MATITLAYLQERTEAKFGSTDIELPQGVLKLRNPLRMSEVERKEFFDLSNTEEAEDSNDLSQADQLRTMLRLAAEDKDLVEQFIDFAGEDLGLLATTMQAYTEGVKAGEA